MKTNSHQLIQQLINHATAHLHFIEALQTSTDAILNKEPDEVSWSIAQVLQHLNTYSEYYLPLIDKAYASSNKGFDARFRSGLLGDFFVGMMQPQNGTISKKYKAACKHQPTSDVDSRRELKNAINHQRHFITLLEQARQHDLNGIRIPVSIASVIKIKLGDVFRFMVAHQQRHTIQMQNISVKAGSDISGQ